MAAPFVKPILTVRGVLSFGGTQIGATKGHFYSPGHRTEVIPAWEFGGSAIEKIQMGSNPYFLAVMRSMDDDGLNIVFPSTEVTGGKRRIVHKVNDDSVARSGSKLSSRADVLLWTPEKTTDEPAVKMYAAVVEVKISAELQFSPLAEFGIPILFTALPYTDGIQDRMGKLGDLA